MKKSLEDRIADVIQEKVAIVPYDPVWPILFEQEKKFLEECFSDNKGLIRRIEHFGSTAVLDLSAKPIVDMLVEVRSLAETKKIIVPFLEEKGYDYFWRPLFDKMEPPFYAWFIKRDETGSRTHHIHLVEYDSILWDRLYFRDYLIRFPEIAKQYSKLKTHLAQTHCNNRIIYTKEKTNFILPHTQKAKTLFKK